jgi:hypothetical protein
MPNKKLQRIAKSVTFFAKRLQNNRHFSQHAELSVIRKYEPTSNIDMYFANYSMQ